MKHITIVFCKVLSGLFQQGYFSQKRKDLLLSTWQKAAKAGDKKKLKVLVNELACVNQNRSWQAELNSILEELSLE